MSYLYIFSIQDIDFILKQRFFVLEMILKYLICISILYGIYADNDMFKDRIDILERQMVEMRENSERTEAEFRAEIKELHNKIRKGQEKIDEMAVSNEEVLATLRKSLGNCLEISETFKKRNAEIDPSATEVAFFAKLGQETNHLGIEQTIIFDDDVTNIDSTNSPTAYNRHTGVFTAPVNGLYVFSTTVLSSYHSTSHFRFYLNHTPLTIMYVHGNASSGWDSASQTIVLNLKRGDVVSVKNTENDTGVLGGGHSIFSGFLLREHDEDVIVG